MNLSDNDIKEYYKKLSDFEITNLAKNPAGLRKEIVPIFIEELKSRGLKADFENWVKVETDTFEGTERDLIVAQIEQTTCCNCGNTERLFGFRYDLIYGVIIVTKFEFIEKILCKDCGAKERFKNMRLTALLGWWSGKGFIYTPFILINSLYRHCKIESESKKVIGNFIDSNTGKLRLANQNKTDIQNLIQKYNNKISDSPFSNIR